MNDNKKSHWEHIYEVKTPEEVSWTQEKPETSLNFIQKGEDVLLITEETSSSNDNKLFNKIPLICSELKIVTKTLPELIGLFNDEIKFNIVK